jgi:lysylphosphatidylglycerol synthetase-like protein (DUF2156 family)
MLFNKLNPFVLIGRIPAVKKKFEEQGTTHLEVTNKIWGDKRYGFSIMLSGAGLVIILFFMIWTLFLVLNSLLNQPIKFSWEPFFACMVLAYIICYFTVFQKDKYIPYFKQFDKWSNQQRWGYGLLSFIFIIGMMTVFVYSFRFLPQL